MSLFKEFNELFPYIVSVRKLKTYLCFDVEFPDTWKIPKKFINEERVVEQNKKNENMRFYSFVADFNETSVNDISNSIIQIIKYNKEREEKERLLESKVSELKKIFESQNLNNLQNLKFEIQSKIKLEDDEEEVTNTNGKSTDLATE